MAVAERRRQAPSSVRRTSAMARTPSASGPRRVVTEDVARENASWVRALTSSGDSFDRATSELYTLLVKIAYVELRRQGSRLRLSGPELDDVAHQAAGDATLTICRKVESFRGECRFTTWAYRFVAFEVSAKVNRHAWNRPGVPLEDHACAGLTTDPDKSPERCAEGRDMLQAVTQIFHEHLSARQQHAFEAIAVRGHSVRQVADDLGSNPNAVYKIMFDARRKLRDGLIAAGYLGQPGSELPAHG